VSTAPPASTALRDVGEALRAAGFTERGIASASGGDAEAFLFSTPPEVQARRIAPTSGLGRLVALLLLGEVVPEAAVVEVLGRRALQALVERGLAAPTGRGVRGLVQVTPWRDLHVLTDRPPLGAATDDHVLEISRPTRALADLAVPPDGGRLLDLGTGSGALALAAAGRASEVVGTDVSARALRMAGWNAELNGVSTAQWRAGSFYEPVAGERFDRILANPPFVVSPETRLVYRDGGGGRDEVSRTVVAGAADHLARGGIAQVMANWVRDPDEHWLAPLLGWLGSAEGCDVLVLHHATVDALDYAAAWNEHLRLRDPPAYAATMARWCDHYAAEGIRAIANGLVVLRRRAEGTPWRRAAEMVSDPGPRAGAQIGRMLEAPDLLASRGDAALLGSPLRAAEGVERTTTRPLTGAGHEQVLVELRGGAGVRCAIPPEVVGVLDGLDGRTTASRLLAGLDGRLGVEVVRALRDMAGAGLLTGTL
jgi:methylase of polypeptide subunit release factors